jgi:AcrR family transcriptional regulator
MGDSVIVTRLGTPERLIRAAQEELIHTHGLLEMQAVARRAKVSVGLAYHHFGSKAGLIAAVVEGFYNRLEEVAFSPSKLISPDWAGREKERIAAYILFHYDHPFAALVVGPLSRAAEVLDVEQAFTKRQLTAGAYNLRAGQRAGVVLAELDPRLTIALMIGGIRQALIGALVSSHRPDRDALTDKIWAFVAGALRLPAVQVSTQGASDYVALPQTSDAHSRKEPQRRG